jgi:hypothetical protein
MYNLKLSGRLMLIKSEAISSANLLKVTDISGTIRLVGTDMGQRSFIKPFHANRFPNLVIMILLQ